MTRTRRSLYTIGAAYLNTSIGLISGLVATPLLLEWLGKDRVGLTRMAVEWFGYAALIGLGLDGALSVRYAKAASDGDRPAMLALIRGGVRAYFLVSLGSMLWIGLLYAFAPLAFNLTSSNLPAEFRATLSEELHAGLLIVMLGQLGLIFAAFRPLADAEQRGYVTNLCLAFGTFVGMVLSIGLAYSHGGLAGQLAALTAMTVIGTVLIACNGLRRYPEVLRHPFGSFAGGLRATFGIMLIYQICSRVSFLSDCIIIGQVIGVEAVAPFSTTQRLLLLLQTIVFVIGGATWSALANLYHGGQYEMFHHRLVQLTRLVAVIACAAAVPAAVWNRQFVLSWVGDPTLYVGDPLSYLTAATVAIQCVLALWGWPITTMGHVRKALPYFLIGLVVNLSVSITATYWLGYIGPTIGTLVNLIAVALWWCPLVLERQLGTPARRLLLAAARPWLLAIPYGVLLALVASQVELTDYLSGRIVRMLTIAAIIGVSGVGYIALAFAVVVPAADRREWLGRFRNRRAAS